MARNTIIFVTLFATILSVGYAKSLPDCDDFIEDAPLSVHVIDEDCSKNCTKEVECFKNCVLTKVQEQGGEDGEYLKFIISNVSTPKPEGWMQDLAKELLEKCVPLAVEQKKMEEAFDCYMKATVGKCAVSA